jgi:hypothetical protein
MTNTTTFWRYFFAHQDPAQERWLDAQARRGLHLVKPGLFRFTFAQGAPSDARYRLDFQMLRGEPRREYLALFNDAGWEFLGQVANRYYFRARPDALSPEILSDAESRRDRIRRQMQIAGALTALLTLQVAIGTARLLESLSSDGPHGPTSVPIMTIVLAGSFAVLGTWVLWQMQQAYKRQG